MFLHYVSVFKNIFKPGLLFVARIRVIVGGNNKYISITPYLSPTFPPRGKFIALAIHRVVGSIKSFAVHRVVFAAQIPVITWIQIRLISGGHVAAFRTVNLPVLRREFAHKNITAGNTFLLDHIGVF